jgi:hypothetical protein
MSVNLSTLHTLQLRIYVYIGCRKFVTSFSDINPLSLIYDRLTGGIHVSLTYVGFTCQIIEIYIETNLHVCKFVV